MRLCNYTYTSLSDLKKFITDNDITDSKRVLLQLFSGDMDKNKISDILNNVIDILPNINIIGCSSFGEISDGNISRESILLTFSIFDNTEIKPFYFENALFSDGETLVKSLVTPKSKCIILFSEALITNPIPFMDGITSVNNQIIVAGGNAGDNNTFSETFIIAEGEIKNKGVCGVVLDSDVLRLNNNYALNWMPFGKAFTITKIEGNKIVELDDTPIVEIVRHYFGQEAVDNLPASIIEFPLLIEIENTICARSVIAADESGFLYAGNFWEGAKVRFGVGDIENMNKNAALTAEKLLDKPTEAIFSYSCAARLSFLGDNLDIEFKLLNQVADTGGFFTYGEFYYTGKSTQMLNITTTFLALSESDSISDKQSQLTLDYTPKNRMLKYFTNFINTMAMELEDNLNSLSNYKDMLDAITIVSKTDLNGNITYVNEAFCNITEYTEAELIGQPHNIVKHPTTPVEIHRNLWETLGNGKVWRGIHKNRTKNGETIFLDSVILPLKDKHGQVTEYAAIRHDMTKVMQQEQIINESHTDNLTRVPNRTKLFHELDKLQIKFLAILNIDGFKGINDLYGFEIADMLLVKLTGLISSKIPSEMLLYRIGGDEFVITMDKGSLDKFKEKIVSLVTDINQNTFKCENYEIDINVTAGIAYNTPRLLTTAEVALRSARKHSMLVDFITQESPESNTYLENTKWMNMVREALNSNNILNYYQPIQNLNDPTDVKYEALVRLKDKDGNIHSPFSFLPVIKQTRNYEFVSKSVIFNLYEVCNKFGYNFSVNLSAEDIKNESTIVYLKQVLSMNNIAERITLEITESETIDDYNLVKQFIKDFKDMGCKIAIDDFGSGYSNFAYLTQFDVDYLKIDGSIVKRVLEDEAALITFEIILDFAKRLGVKTIAEFVSDKEIYDKVKELGVDYVQGYFVGKPAPILL